MIKTLQAAQGKWPGILKHFGVDERALRNEHGPCPMCGGKDRFRFDDKDGEGTYFCSGCGAGGGMKLLQEFKGWDFAEAARQVDKIIDMAETTKIPLCKPDPAIRINKTAELIKPISSEVRQYLDTRGLKPTKYIMSANLNYWHGGRKKGRFNCMILPVTSPDNKRVSYHITYLRHGKKAPVESPKKMLPPAGNLKGCAIRLTDIYKHIGVAEGIETALAVMQLYKMPCWSVVNANMMEHFKPPAGVEQLTIFGDKDGSYTGQKAAFTLAHSLRDSAVIVDVQFPGMQGDFADQLASKVP